MIASYSYPYSFSFEGVTTASGRTLAIEIPSIEPISKASAVHLTWEGMPNLRCIAFCKGKTTWVMLPSKARDLGLTEGMRVSGHLRLATSKAPELPEHIAQRLEEVGIDLGQITEAERRQIAAIIRESATEDILEQRVSAFILAHGG